MNGLCVCGNEIAPVLARLGSARCHDCRDNPSRYADAVDAALRSAFRARRQERHRD